MIVGMQDVAAPQNPICLRFQWLLWQHVGWHCHAAAKSSLTIILDVWCELQALGEWPANHNTLHCCLFSFSSKVGHKSVSQQCKVGPTVIC